MTTKLARGWVGGGDPAPLPGHRQKVLELRKCPGQPTSHRHQDRANTPPSSLRRPGEADQRRRGVSEETSLLLQALTARALSHQQEQGKAVKFCFFLNFLGLGFSKPSQ